MEGKKDKVSMKDGTNSNVHSQSTQYLWECWRAVHQHRMFKDTLDTGLSDGTRSKLSHPAYAHMWTE